MSLINSLTDQMRWEFEARQKRQKGILKELHKLQIQYISKVTMWVEIADNDSSVQVTLFVKGDTKNFNFYEFRDDDEINELFENLKKALKDERKA